MKMMTQGTYHKFPMSIKANHLSKITTDAKEKSSRNGSISQVKKINKRSSKNTSKMIMIIDSIAVWKASMESRVYDRTFETL